MAVLVTGGAGFIGSCLVDKLVSEGKEVLVLDNLSIGKKELINQKAEFIKFDLCSDPTQLEGILEEVDRVWHLAANPDVKLSGQMPKVVYDNNILATFNLLEAMRKSACKEIIFTSTSTVYGEAKEIPTPETYSGTPVSVYGATKLSCEALISSYCHSFGMKSWIYRLANIIGPRSNHGIIPDFVSRLKKKSTELEILGDGRQNKSYLHIDDCISGMLAGLKTKEAVNIFNIGNIDRIEVSNIAKIICEEMNINPKISYTGGKTGWVGDVPVMLLSIDKIAKLGWLPTLNSSQAVEKTAKEILG
jgi:UDP-glucose 4-epimerase